MVNFQLHYSNKWPNKVVKMVADNTTVKITLTFVKYHKETEDHHQVEPLERHQVNKGTDSSVEFKQLV